MRISSNASFVVALLRPLWNCLIVYFLNLMCIFVIGVVSELTQVCIVYSPSIWFTIKTTFVYGFHSAYVLGYQFAHTNVLSLFRQKTQCFRVNECICTCERAGMIEKSCQRQERRWRDEFLINRTFADEIQMIRLALKSHFES